MKSRVAVFVDGFNLYHALDEREHYYPYKWLNLSKLASFYCDAGDELADVYYFTALAHWDKAKVRNHQIYIRALRSQGIKCVYGKFKHKSIVCRQCKKSIPKPEEKRTDVNIAIRLFQQAYEDAYDKAIIVSGDSDLVPAVEAVHECFPEKKIGLVVPIGRRADELLSVVDYKREMRTKQLRSARFEDVLELGNGVVLECPERWKYR